jgi:hypothetical protein
MKQAACFILLLCSLTSAETQKHTAGKLRDDCRWVEVSSDVKITQVFDTGLCLGYMKGFLDGLFFAPQITVDADVTAGQLVHVLAKYLGDHPEYENKSSNLILMMALRDTHLVSVEPQSRKASEP